jgi:FkbM family methyltransferase
MRTITYAQNREDIIIDWFFKDRERGFYIDVGAGNPDIDTVTKLFYDKDWRGINIEPIGHIYKYITKRRKRDINLNLGISNKLGKLSFREYATDGLSTFSTEMKDDYIDNPSNITNTYIDYDVQVVTLKEIFAEHVESQPVQLLKVDVEGYEYEVLNGNDWKKYRPELLCIEANHVKHDWRPMLLKNKYIKAYHDGLNEYYVAAESTIPKSLDYVAAIINREPIVHYKTQQQINEYLTIIKHKDNHVKELEKALAETRDQLEKIKTIRSHLVESGKSRVKRLSNRNANEQ